MDNENKDEITATAETAGAEERKQAATELGKFQSVDALLNAYLNLEAEFTRRSQRLKELEEGNKAQAMSDSDAPSPEGLNTQMRALDEEEKKRVIEEYLKSIQGGKSVPLISGGVPCAAPRQAPKSIREAGALAAQFLKK